MPRSDETPAPLLFGSRLPPCPRHSFGQLPLVGVGIRLSLLKLRSPRDFHRYCCLELIWGEIRLSSGAFFRIVFSSIRVTYRMSDKWSQRCRTHSLGRVVDKSMHYQITLCQFGKVSSKQIQTLFCLNSSTLSQPYRTLQILWGRDRETSLQTVRDDVYYSSKIGFQKFVYFFSFLLSGGLVCC